MRSTSSALLALGLILSTTAAKSEVVLGFEFKSFICVPENTEEQSSKQVIKIDFVWEEDGFALLGEDRMVKISEDNDVFLFRRGDDIFQFRYPDKLVGFENNEPMVATCSDTTSSNARLLRAAVDLWGTTQDSNSTLSAELAGELQTKTKHIDSLMVQLNKKSLETEENQRRTEVLNLQVATLRKTLSRATERIDSIPECMLRLSEGVKSAVNGIGTKETTFQILETEKALALALADQLISNCEAQN